MRIIEYKLSINQESRAAMDEAIRTVQFVRNKCLRLSHGWSREWGP